MLLLLGLRGCFDPVGLTRSLRVSDDSSMYARFSPKKSNRVGSGGEQALTTRTGTSFSLPSDFREPSSPHSGSFEFGEFDSDSDQDSDGVTDPETDPDADSDTEGYPEWALDPRLDCVFSSNREMDLDPDLDPAPSANLNPGLISYLPSNLDHDLEWYIASDLISDAEIYLDSGQTTSKWPFSRIASEILCADPVTLTLGCR